MTRYLLFGAAVLMVLAAAGGAYAQQLGAGDPAPAFELPGTDGNTHRLADYRGRDGRSGLVHEGVHRRLSGRMQIAAG